MLERQDCIAYVTGLSNKFQNLVDDLLTTRNDSTVTIVENCQSSGRHRN